MDFLNGKIVIRAKEITNSLSSNLLIGGSSPSCLIIVIVNNQSPSIKLDKLVIGVIEINNVLVAYGGNFVSLIKIDNVNNQLVLSTITTQQIVEDQSNINCFLYQQETNLFFGAHESGNLTAWEPCETGLVNKGILKVSQSVSTFNF